MLEVNYLAEECLSQYLNTEFHLNKEEIELFKSTNPYLLDQMVDLLSKPIERSNIFKEQFQIEVDYKPEVNDILLENYMDIESAYTKTLEIEKQGLERSL